MAQALLNNLNNTLSDSSFALDKTQDASASLEFDSILATKKDSINTNSTDITNIEQLSGDSEEAYNNIFTAAVDTMDDIVSVAEAAVEVVSEIAANINEDVLCQENTEITDNTETEICEYNEIKTDDGDSSVVLDEITEENNENTITYEDPIQMNEKLNNTLENPAAAIFLQSQPSNIEHQVVQNEEIDSNSIEILPQEQKAVNDKLIKLSSAKPLDYTEIKTNSSKVDSQSKTLRELVDESMLDELNIESVSSSTTSNGDSSELMQYQTPQEQAVKVMLHSDVKFDDIKIMQAQQKNETVSVQNSVKILEQITKQMEGIYNSSKVDIVLNPASLGKVVLKLVNSSDGLLAQFTVTNQETHNILMKGIAGLRESLLSHGISVDNVIVKMNESEFSKGDDKNDDLPEQNNSRGGGKEQGFGRQKQQEKNFEQTMFEITNT